MEMLLQDTYSQHRGGILTSNLTIMAELSVGGVGIGMLYLLGQRLSCDNGLLT